MLAIVDYGVGNLFSLCSSLKSLDKAAIVTSDPEKIRAAERIILPGVGAFGDAAEKLRKSGLDTLVREEAASGKPLLGICLGMQLLFEKSYEFGEHPGLGLLRGSIIPMKGTIPEALKIPQMGWNSLIIKRSHPLLRDVKEGDCVYFVHSYYAADCEDSLIVSCDYGRELTAAVAQGNVMGCQFHPEKSGKVGLSILKAFCEVEV
ncbi:MAG: imidazole glycerol phosphate synthase subunit HisH [Oscillospiraceae bacterium]|nr:imidazole glycerol phosphate synthase subunit HisH [Oscillospiraceae bacterium]